MNVLYLIEIYERELENLKWNLNQNSEYHSKWEKERIECRIQDRERFISDLKRLL